MPSTVPIQRLLEARNMRKTCLDRPTSSCARADHCEVQSAHPFPYLPLPPALVLLLAVTGNMILTTYLQHIDQTFKTFQLNPEKPLDWGWRVAGSGPYLWSGQSAVPCDPAADWPSKSTYLPCPLAGFKQICPFGRWFKWTSLMKQTILTVTILHLEVKQLRSLATTATTKLLR